MPLTLPNLDTRTWVDLVDEARALIPRFAPGWTDHNIHDSGITLIELLAWLVERDVYRLNRVTDAHRRRFLELIGSPPRSPQAARAVIGVAPTGALDIPAGAEFAATTSAGNVYLFRSAATVQAEPTALAAVLVQSADGAAPQDVTRLLSGGVSALGDDPAPGVALWLRFSAALPAAKPVRLGFRSGGDRAGFDERRRILDEAAAEREACRHPPPLDDVLRHHSARLDWEFSSGPETWHALDAGAGEVDDDTRALTLDGGVTVLLPVAMQSFGKPGEAPTYYLRARLAAGAYDAPPQLVGVVVNAVDVEQAVPVNQAYAVRPGVVAGGTVPTDPGKNWFRMRRVRVKLRLDADNVISALTFVTDEGVPEVLALYFQPATATEAGILILECVVLGRSAADLFAGRLLVGGNPDPRYAAPGQMFPLPRAAVQGGSCDVFTLEPPAAAPAAMAWRAWEVRPDFDASTGRDAHVLLDESAATVTFGDGDLGRIPPVGTPVLARYRATTAAAGNVAAGLSTVVAPTLHNWLLFDPDDFQSKAAGPHGPEIVFGSDPGQVWAQRSAAGYAAVAAHVGRPVNPAPAASGAAAETIAGAAARAFAALHAPTRAVTPSDYETLALATPGTQIARAHALPGLHPDYPCLSAPGVVTVIIVPAQRRPRPAPSPGLLRRVRRYMDRRRILGTHVEVVAPLYLTVQVTATVRARAGADPARVEADVIAALNRFLHPLTGGPAVVTATSDAAPGWPFGRDVYRTEVMQVIDGVDGVDHVEALELSGDGSPGQCGNLCVRPTQLVVAGAHTLEVLSP
jgi:hypothetical protein